MGTSIVAACRQVSQLPVDVHLMIENPERYIEAFAKAGASLITIHVETGYHPYRTLQAIRDLGCRPGIAINPGTAATAILPMLSLVDMVLVLGTNPGFSGQAFIPQMLTKLVEIRQQNTTILIEVDGGMNAETLPAAFHAGANVFVAGNAVFKHPEGIASGVQTLRALT